MTQTAVMDVAEMATETNDNLAVLVFGPCSTGTRFCTRLIIAAGVAGDGTQQQRWDKNGPPDPVQYPKIVWRRSVPHGAGQNRWMPRPQELYPVLKEQGYTNIRGVLTIRNWYEMITSQLEHGHFHDRDICEKENRHALELIVTGFEHLGIPWHWFDLDACKAVGRDAVWALYDQLGLARTTDYEHPDELFKYFTEME